MSVFNPGDKVVTVSQLTPASHPAFYGVVQHLLDARQSNAPGIVRGTLDPVPGIRREELFYVDHTEPLPDGTVYSDPAKLAVYLAVDLVLPPAAQNP